MYLKLFFMLAAVLPAAEPPAFTLDSVVAAVIRRNPEARAAAIEGEQALKQAQGASSWEAPQLSLELMQAPDFDFSRTGSRRWLLNQALPFPGRATLQGGVARHDAMRKVALAQSAREARIFEARSAYWSLASAAYGQQALEHSLQAVEALKAISAARGRFGRLDRMGQVMDAMFGMDSASMKAMQLEWRQQRLEAETALNRLMGEDASRALADPTDDPRALGAVPPPDAAALRQGIDEGNPDLQEARHHVLHAQSLLRESRTEWLPNVMLQAGWDENDAGMHDGSAMLGLSLPWLWYGKAAADNASAALELEHAKTMQQAQKLRLDEEARVDLGAWQSAQEQLKLTLNEALPAAESAMREATAGYKSGGVDAAQARQSVMGYWAVQENAAMLIREAGVAMAKISQLTASASSAGMKEMSHE